MSQTSQPVAPADPPESRRTPVPSRFEGGCACRAIRYACSTAPLAMVNCYCRDCQQASGSGHSAIVVVTCDALQITQGEPRYFQCAASGGSTSRRGFCSHCGSQLFTTSSTRPDLIGIRAGSLDDPSWFHPTIDIWTENAQPWDRLSADTLKFAHGPVQKTGG